MSLEREIQALREALVEQAAASQEAAMQQYKALAQVEHQFARSQATLEDSLQALRDLSKKLAVELRGVWEDIHQARRDSLELSSALTLGLDLSATRMIRSIPIVIYMSHASPETIDKAVDAMQSIATALDFELAADYPEVHGSWYKRFLARSKDLLTQPEVSERLERLERAAEIRILEKPQADVDGVQSAAIARLIKALDKVPNAAVQAGSVLVVKITTSTGPSIQARTLTQLELQELESNQLLLQEPHHVLARLADACGKESSATRRVRHTA